MNLTDFDYDLPKEFIAQQPLKKRDESKLLVYNKNIHHKKFKDIIHYLEKDDVLVINETKVKKVRLNGEKETGSPAEVIILEHLENNKFKVKIDSRNPRGKIIFEDFECEIYDKKGDEYFVEFNKKIDLKKAKVPLPAYIKTEVKDEQYQTVYCQKEGSFAAPTAGLHFTNELLDKIKEKGVKIAKVCLHVTFGTFLEIKEEDFTKHEMHEEDIEISTETANIINNRKGKLFVVGTTSLRTIESSHENKIIPCKKSTKLFIYPGYKFKNKIDGIITNFHLPKSSLLLLVSAYIGKDILFELYETAKRENYRFYSFGDAMFLSK